MKKNQNVKHKPSQIQQPRPEKTSRKHQANIWLTMFYWFFMIGLFCTSVGVAVYGLNKLLNVDDAPQVKHNTTLTLKQDTTNSDLLPTWMIIAIAFCCTTGCLVIFSLIKPSKPAQKTPQHQKQKLPVNESQSSQELENLPDSVSTKENDSLDTNPEALAD
ncbi:MAG TPA: hypothetical protein VK184_01200 [Nostocaceae cyanobacterium]|nr:hypothetical protein [Nostocaceae cyanobacterium]